jgi:hypothetical protein
VAQHPPQPGAGGHFLFNNNTFNPSGTSDSTIVQKEKNIKKRKEKVCENHSEEISKNFEIFWQAYPRCKRKTDKKTSLRRFAAAFRENKDLSFEAMMKGLDFWKNDYNWQKDNGQYIEAPEVWLHKCRWVSAENELSQPSEPPRFTLSVPSSPPPQPKDEVIRMSHKELAELFRPSGSVV